MKKFLGVLKYEYRMSIMRPGVLIVAGLFGVLFLFLVPTASGLSNGSQIDWWEEAGWLTFSLNLFFPVFAGIIAADRGVRDIKLDVRELLRVTELSNTTYILGKYAGVVLSLLTLQFAEIILIALAYIGILKAPWGLLPNALLASLLVNVPGVMFVTAFSLACPLFMPVRVYQILFTGYWYWGNYLNPDVIPSVSDTVLNAAGIYSLSAVFGAQFGEQVTTIGEVVINVSVLLACAGIALFGMERILSLQESRR